MKRQIIAIDEKKCTGCGDCIPGCPEGALQVIDGKARLVSDLFCDGLGACTGHCPTGAMTISSREVEPYDERRVMHERIVSGGADVIAAHLKHLLDHGQTAWYAEALAYLEEQGVHDRSEVVVKVDQKPALPASSGHGSGCPGSRMMSFGSDTRPSAAIDSPPNSVCDTELRQWPVQLHLVTPTAPYYEGSDLLLAADCTAFAAGDFHQRFMKGKSLAIACPKLDSDMDVYVEKLAAMIDKAEINTITAVIMEVPCCGGLMALVAEAQKKVSRKIPVKRVVMSVRGEVLSDEWV
ncbi:MAG: 4Fe-4S binding protein [Chlorobium sp.]|jgi:ferredoxin|nr:4Fe-4S binding protein [Chlorobium sp.]